MNAETALEHAVVARKVVAQCQAISAAKEHLEKTEENLEQVVKGPPFGDRIADAFVQLSELDLNLPPDEKRERALQVALAPFQDASSERLVELLDEAETEGEAVAVRWLLKELDHVDDTPPGVGENETDTNLT